MRNHGLGDFAIVLVLIAMGIMLTILNALGRIASWFLTGFHWLLVLAPVVLIWFLAERYGKYLSRLSTACFGGIPDGLKFWLVLLAGLIALPVGLVVLPGLVVATIHGTVPGWFASTVLSFLFFAVLHIGSGENWSTWAWLKQRWWAPKPQAVQLPPRDFGDGYVGSEHETYKAGL